MKIKPDIKYKNLPPFVISQLSFVDIDNVKWGSATFVLILYDLPLLLSFLALMKIEFLWIMVPFAIILNLWCLRLLIKNPYSTQIETIKFLGGYGAIGAITFYTIFQVISYFSLNIYSIMYYIILNFAIIISSYVIIKYQITKFKDIHLKLKYSDKNNKNSRYATVIAIVPALGYIVGQFVGEAEILKYYYVLGVDFFLTLLCVYIATKFIHRYYFMKANMDYVVFQKPNKREKKELNKKGIVIK
ncbi:hypothetical protein KQI49_00825 [Virgibacillus sp. MSJ-26]|uniref:hypothetical protein n=1 Tax=Virgibacillus sp. MSJ-26 TaxID=2841522 RepID=UPI001C10073B|nr:hypothetical protein [Virgibacillus sp. MSJ-26]MBU5465369.1 hypothetical protein [Virgibacillus sp. MSJ-26]